MPDFTLRDQDGRRSARRSLRGRPVVFAFIYSTCRDTCPAQVQTIRNALDELPAAERTVQVVGISVDPANDTSKRAQSFLLKQQMTGRMRFLLGSRAQLAPVWEAFGVQPQSDKLEHSAHTVLADADGLQRIGFPYDHLDRRGARARSRAALKLSGRFDDLKFFGQWRPYQRAALAAFEKDRAAGNLSTHIVAPPGSGKTLLGVELIRRVGKRALVLAPNQGIQQQWPRAVGEFTPNPAEIAGADPLKPIACLSYQALCQLEDPEIVLGRLAQSRWADERAAATGMSPEEASARARRSRARPPTAARASCRGSAPRSSARSRAASTRASSCATCCPTTAKQRVQQLAKMGVGVVLLDECHHLASLWGYVVRAVLGELGEKVHVIGLTATPPIGLPEAEAELYDALLGPGRLHRPHARRRPRRPPRALPGAGVADRAAAAPSASGWPSTTRRFRELITTLHDDAESDISFPRWVGRGCATASARPTTRPRCRWEAFQKRSPKLARAGIRFLLSAGLSIPAGAPRGEAYRQPPDLEDWLVLLEDYALRCLASSETREAGERYDAIAAALRELGFQLTRKGIRRGTSEVDRLLTGSQAKALGLVEVLSAELDTRGDALRALVLCDAELASQRPDDALTGVLDPAAGTARHALLAIANDAAPRRCVRCWSPAAGCAARRRTPTCCWRRSRRPPPSASRCPSGRPTSTACWSR